jgi:hypothetical protein
MTSGPQSSHDPSATPARSSRRWWRFAGFCVGVLALAAAVLALVSQRGSLDAAWRSARGAPAWMIAAALLLPLVNLLCSSGSFWILTRRFGRVGFCEMLGLIASAWLLNYLPVRPGLVGRVAYHKVVNNIPVRASAAVLGANLGVGFITIALLAAGAIAASSLGLARSAVGAIMLGPFAGAGLLAAFAAGFHPWIRPLAFAFAFRYADSLVWAVRYALVFAIVGRPIGVPESMALAVVAQAAMLVPFVGNGLGVREWAVGLLSSALPRSGEQSVFAPTAAGGAGVASAVGLSADLINRVAELLVSIPIGIIATMWVARTLARHRDNK